MGIRFAKTIGAIVAGIATVGLVVGCGVDGTAVKAGAGADPSKVHDLVLGEGDFPSSYKVTPVPRAQTQEMLDQILASTKAAKVTPSHCKQASSIPDSVSIDSIGLVVATDPTTFASLTESISVTGQSIGVYRDMVSGDCGRMTMVMDVAGQSVTGEVVQKVVPGPTVDAADSFVVEMETTSKVERTTVEMTTLMGYAEVNGYIVCVQAMGSVRGAEPDRSEFDALFVNAVDKVKANS